ncbi:MAG: hypothetical protein EAY75_04615 [Bacteroidetes bacterium]|nr:MAG: hypothetical protein EAY75_04615 [Bacteroidota bacterium]
MKAYQRHADGNHQPGMNPPWRAAHPLLEGGSMVVYKQTQPKTQQGVCEQLRQALIAALAKKWQGL